MSARKRFSVHPLSIEGATSNLPSLRRLDQLPSPIQLYIAAAGFEDRVLAVPQWMRDNSVRIVGTALLGRYRTNPEDNARREAEVIPLLRERGATIATFDADSPAATFNSIRDALACAPEGSVSVLLDVSGASSTLIFSALSTLLRATRPIELTIVYATAKQYHEPASAREKPVLEWASEDFREGGVSEVEVNELQAGIHHDHLPTFVIALPSMFSARLQRCLSYLGIDALSGTDRAVHWILPSTSDAEHKWRQTRVLQALQALCANGDNEMPIAFVEDAVTHCDVLNYIESLRAVLKQSELHAGANLSVVHMGTKMQAVGVALALAARPEIALVSARPEWFSATTYSNGVGEVYVIELGNPAPLLDRIARIGTLEIRSATL